MPASCPRAVAPCEALEKFFPEAFTLPDPRGFAEACATTGSPGLAGRLFQALEQDSPDHRAFRIACLQVFIRNRVQTFHQPGLLDLLGSLTRERFPDNPGLLFPAPTVTAVFARAEREEEPLGELIEALAVAFRPDDGKFQEECRSVGTFLAGQLGFVMRMARAVREPPPHPTRQEADR